MGLKSNKVWVQDLPQQCKEKYDTMGFLGTPTTMGCSNEEVLMYLVSGQFRFHSCSKESNSPSPNDHNLKNKNFNSVQKKIIISSPVVLQSKLRFLFLFILYYKCGIYICVFFLPLQFFICMVNPLPHIYGVSRESFLERPEN